MAKRPSRKLPVRSIGLAKHPVSSKEKAMFGRPQGGMTTNQRRIPNLGVKVRGYSGRFFTREQAWDLGYNVETSRGRSSLVRIKNKQGEIPHFDRKIVSASRAFINDEHKIKPRLPQKMRDQIEEAGPQTHGWLFYIVDDRRTAKRARRKKSSK